MVSQGLLEKGRPGVPKAQALADSLQKVDGKENRDFMDYRL